MSTRKHGSYVKYVIERCRCEDCREANREYEHRRTRRKAYGGDYWPWVDAKRARKHVRALMGSRPGGKDGLGPKRIAKLSGVPHGAISKLIYGDYGRGMPPSKRIHRETERKLLAVKPSAAFLIDAAPTWRQIDELVAFGFPKSRIALAIGKGSATLQFSDDLIKRDNADAIARLHWHVWRKAPRFRQGCDCLPPVSILDLLEGEGDDTELEAPTSGWSYPSAWSAKSAASRFSPPAAPCVVTEEDDGYHWYPGPEFVPKRARVVSTRQKVGCWLEAVA